MTFFYDLNKRLATLAGKQDAEQLAEHSMPASQPKSQLAQALNERDLGKHNNATTGFAALAKKTGGGEKGNRIAGAQLAKMRAKGQVEESDMEESAFQAAIGKKKYGDQGMKALQKAGREGASDKTMNNIRNRYDKYDESQGMTDEGNAFTAALKATPKGGKFKVGGKEFTDNSDLEEGFADMNAWLASREKEKGTGRFDKRERTLPSGMKATTYTRKPETFDDPETDPEATGGAPKRRGRPKGKDKGPERVTAKSYKYKAGRPTKTQEDLDADGVMMTRPSNMSSEGINSSEYDQEGDMAKKDLKSLAMAAKELHAILGDNQNLPEWVQSKITKALDYINSSNQYMHQEQGDMVKEGNTDDLTVAVGILGKLVGRSEKGQTIDPEELATQLRLVHERLNRLAGGFAVDTLRPETKPVTEKAVSKSQQQAAGIALAAKRSNKKPGGKGAAAEMSKMPEKELEKFAKTKHKGLPKQVKKADEGKGDGNLANNAKPYDKVTQGDVVAGRLGKDEMGGKKKKEDKVDETTVAGSVATAPTVAKKSSSGMQFGKGVYEGFNNQVESMITEGMSVNISVDEQGKKSINVNATEQDAEALADLLKMAGLGGAGREESCAEVVDENSPDYPTNTETSNNALQYSGGLNGPKSTGQTTVPVVASQERRLHSESVELERNLFKTWKHYKG